MKIKKEKYSIRCEICHQKDYFEPELNYCLRCQEVIDKRSLSPVQKKQGKKLSSYLKIGLSNLLANFVFGAIFFIFYRLYLMDRPIFVDEEGVVASVLIGIFLGFVVVSPIGLIIGILAIFCRFKRLYANLLLGLLISCFTFCMWFGFRKDDAQWVFLMLIFGIFSGLFSFCSVNWFYKFYEFSLITRGHK